MKYCLKHFQSVLKSETVTLHAALAHINRSLFRKKIKLRDPTYDVTLISTNIQDDEQLNISNKICHEIKQM